MDTSSLRAFLLVAHAGNLTRAAQEIGVSQPGLSRQMARLEAELGVTLFERTHDGLHLTAAGLLYQQFAEEVLQRWQQLLERVHSPAAPVVGTLHIGASTTPAEYLVPAAVAAFTARHPEVQATVVTADTAEVVSGLRQGRWELGVVGAQPEEAGVRYTPLVDDEVVLAVPSSHPFAARKSVSLSMLRSQRFIRREDGSGTLLSIERALSDKELELPALQVAITLSTTQAVISAVRHGLGIGFVSLLALRESGDSPGQLSLVAVRLAEVRVFRKLALAWLTQRTLSHPAQRFADFLCEHIATRVRA